MEKQQLAQLVEDVEEVFIGSEAIGEQIAEICFICGIRAVVRTKIHWRKMYEIVLGIFIRSLKQMVDSLVESN